MQQQGFIKGRNIANIIRGIDYIMEYAYNFLKKHEMDQIPQVSATNKINCNTKLIRSESENIIRIRIIKL